MTRALKHRNPYRKPSAKGCSCTRSGSRVSRTRGVPDESSEWYWSWPAQSAQWKDPKLCIATFISFIFLWLDALQFQALTLVWAGNDFWAVRATGLPLWWRNFAPRAAPAVFVCDHDQVQCGTQLSTSFGLKIAFGKVGHPRHRASASAFFPIPKKKGANQIPDAM